jgi:hypothetical protein
MAELFLYLISVGAALLAFGFLMLLAGRLEAAFERHVARRKYRYGRIYQRYPIG